MKATSVTFHGSLGELVCSLREAARTGIRREAERIFPGVGRGITLQIGNHPTGHVDFEAYDEWRKFPERRQELLRRGRIKVVWLFFDKKIPELEKTFFALYSEDQRAVAEAEESFRKLNSELREVRRRVRVSRWAENEFCQKDFVRAVENFNTSLPPSFAGWKILLECYRPRTRPSKRVTICGHTFRPRPAPREWEFTFPLTVAEIDKLINFSETWASRLKNRPKIGRPPLPFNALLFHVVNGFTQRCLTAKREYIMKDGKFRVRKNWQLVCAALLWLHVLYDIPEMRTFIKTHESEEARAALKRFVSWAKREYSHFRESGKGRGKFGPVMSDGSDLLGIRQVYLTGKGGLRGRLV